MGIGEDVDHVGAVLAGAHDPVDLAVAGIVAADGFGRFGGEPHLALHEGQSVRAAQGAKFDLRFGFLTDEVDRPPGCEIGRSRNWTRKRYGRRRRRLLRADRRRRERAQ